MERRRRRGYTESQDRDFSEEIKEATHPIGVAADLASLAGHTLPGESLTVSKLHRSPTEQGPKTLI